MGDLQCRSVLQCQKQTAAVNLEKFQDGFQGVLDFAVEPVRRHTDKPRRNIRQKAFEAQALLQCLVDLFPLLICLFISI